MAIVYLAIMQFTCAPPFLQELSRFLVPNYFKVARISFVSPRIVRVCFIVARPAIVARSCVEDDCESPQGMDCVYTQPAQSRQTGIVSGIDNNLAIRIYISHKLGVHRRTRKQEAKRSRLVGRRLGSCRPVVQIDVDDIR